jgi:hypothetical protein
MTPGERRLKLVDRRQQRLPESIAGQGQLVSNPAPFLPPGGAIDMVVAATLAEVGPYV